MQTTTHHQPPPSPHSAATSRIPAPWEETYLDTLADTGQKAKAASVAGISLRLVARHRHESPGFARLELEAMEAAFDLFESEAIRRAVEGVEVSRQGRNGEVITRTIYSDTLLLKILQRSSGPSHPKNPRPTPPSPPPPPAAPNATESWPKSPPPKSATSSTPPPPTSTPQNAHPRDRFAGKPIRASNKSE